MPETPVKKIASWIRDAATTEGGRPGHHLRPPAESAVATDFHGERIQAALLRARQKTYVRMLKPLRRFFRNQGAVNDSLIEAVHHLALQSEERAEEIDRLNELLRQMRRPESARAENVSACE